MTRCRQSERVLEALMDTNVGDDERREVIRHAETCESCGDLVRIHRELGATSVSEPSEAELEEMRRGVLRSVRAGAARSGWLEHRDWLWSRRARVAMSGALAAALLLVGFAGGRLQSGRQSLAAGSITGPIERAAARNVRLVESVQSPFSYSDVRLRSVDEETVRLEFDVATHLDLIRSKDDPLVAEILVQSLVTPASVGTRLEAIELAGTMQPKVRDALVVAMLEDPNLAVRLKAISKLTSNGDDPSTQKALLEVLRNEDSVTMRLLAIDSLTSHQVPAESLRLALRQGRPEPGSAVYAKAEKYLRVF